MVDVPADPDVTVTVCAVFALADVKVNELGNTVADAALPLTQLTTTSALGMLVSTTVKLSDWAELESDVMEMAVLLACTPDASTVTTLDMAFEV